MYQTQQHQLMIEAQKARRDLAIAWAKVEAARAISRDLVDDET